VRAPVEHLATYREAAKPFGDFNKVSKHLMFENRACGIKVMEPVFESQTKTRGSTDMGSEPGMPVRTFVNDFVKTKLDN
jgi:topoisomerase-4 subunit B